MNVVMCFGAFQCTLYRCKFLANNKLFKGNNALLKLRHTPHVVAPFLTKKTLENKDRRKQTTNFFIAPLIPIFKNDKIFLTPPVAV